MRLLDRCTVIKSQWVLPHLLARSLSRRCGIRVLGQRTEENLCPVRLGFSCLRMWLRGSLGVPLGFLPFMGSENSRYGVTRLREQRARCSFFFPPSFRREANAAERVSRLRSTEHREAWP